MKVNLKNTRQAFKELLLMGQIIKENEIINYNIANIPNISDLNKKKRKEVIKRILKEKRRN